MSVTADILFAALKATVGLRVSEEEELAGLDVLEHGAPGYGEGFGSFSPGYATSGGLVTATTTGGRSVVESAP